jgi:hypothetical protein
MILKELHWGPDWKKNPKNHNVRECNIDQLGHSKRKKNKYGLDYKDLYS